MNEKNHSVADESPGVATCGIQRWQRDWRATQLRREILRSSSGGGGKRAPPQRLPGLGGPVGSHARRVWYYAPRRVSFGVRGTGGERCYLDALDEVTPLCLTASNSAVAPPRSAMVSSTGCCEGSLVTAQRVTKEPFFVLYT